MKKLLTIVGLVLVIIFVFFLFNRNSQDIKSNIKVDNSTKIRVGWQIPWAIQGQLTQILKHTNILKENTLVGEFKGFTSGAPLNEAALSKEVDVIFTADQPAATLLSKNPNWTIIGRLMYNRVSLYVPPKSPIESVKDLRGKTVAMPFGTAAQRKALEAELNAGLNPLTDVKNINLDIYEQNDLIRNPNAEKWGDIDAMAGFDPTPAIFEEMGLIRNLNVAKVVSVVMMSNDYITKHPQAPKNFMNSLKNAYDYYRKNTKKADQWFNEESKLNITNNALLVSSSLEPNLKVKTSNDIRLSFNEDDYKIMQEAADFIYEQKLVQIHVKMKDHIDLSHLESTK